MISSLGAVVHPSSGDVNDAVAGRSVEYAAGNLTAVATDASGSAVAAHTRLTSGEPTALKLTIDAPSPLTGTGSALVLDGQDSAMLRASVVDAKGEVVHGAKNNVTFSIVSGPGRVVGSHNGNQSCHEPNHAPWHSAYQGLVRGVIMVTEDSATPDWHRDRMLEIDGAANSIVVPSNSDRSDRSGAAEAIVVSIASEGLTSATVSIPVSTDVSKDGVMAVAAATAGKPVTFN